MKRSASAARYAERVLEGLDDAGRPERIVVWIERGDGGLWGVGRAVNPQHRPCDEPRPEDYVCQTYELDEALEQANATLEDDVCVLETEGAADRIPPFTRKEILPKLERYFFRGE